MKVLFSLLIMLTLSCNVIAQQTLNFPSEDGLIITADLYRAKKNDSKKTFIVLFHQAGSSRGEYQNIAPRLTELGYDALAIDQRSGGSFDGITNKTAAQTNVGRDYIKALPDMRAAIVYARNELGADRIIIWGSSYSASLSLVLAGRQDPKVDGVLAFSPGEYFKGDLSVQKQAAVISVPTFITAARNETRQWKAIANAITATKTGFIPEGVGKHGSSALISDDSKEYWQATLHFLKNNFPL